jgi:uncharacterized LabA/DUF88 family protein
MKPGERIALVIDGPNFSHACRQANIGVDWKRVIQHFSDGSPNVRAYYYTAVKEGAEDNPLHRTLDWMTYNGFKVVTKPMKEFRVANDEVRRKGNMDVEIAVDCIEMRDHIDRLVLFSGDGDFRHLVTAVQRKGVRVTVVSTLGVIADELRREADTYIDVASIRHQITRISDVPVNKELTLAD